MRPLLLAMLLFGCERLTVPPSIDSDVSEMEPMEDMSQIDFVSAEECAECHPSQYAEWRQSMHAYAALSPVFDAMAAKAYRDTAGAVGTFCTGCHSPMGTAAGEPGTSVADSRSALSREGVSCDVCHRAVSEDGPIGNANIGYHGGDTKLGPFGDASDDGHDVAYGEYIGTSRFCGNCHDVYQYPGLRIEEAYTEYVESGIEEDGIRCQDCHMSPDPGALAEREVGPIAIDPTGSSIYPNRERSSHRFIGPDYSLLDDFPYSDDPEASTAAQAEYKEQVQTLLENAVELGDMEFKIVEELMTLDVGVQSLVIGHNVPTGFTSERQLWLDIEVLDASGEVVLRTGDLDSYGDLRDHHSWDVLEGNLELDDELVNFQSENRVFRRKYDPLGTFSEAFAEESQSTVFPFDADVIEKNSLEPEEHRVSGFSLGSADSGPYTASISLRYRNLPPYIMRALQLDELVPRLEIFTIDSTTLSSE